LQEILLDAEKNKQIQFLTADQKEQKKMNEDGSPVFSDLNLVNYVKHEVCFVSSSSFISGSTSASVPSSVASSSTASTSKASSKASDKKKDGTSSSTSAYEKNFTLPDGTIIIMADTLRKKAAEFIFDPYTTRGKPIPGIAQTLYNCIQECDSELRKELSSSIIISGGVTNMNGMQSRLRRELEQLSPMSTNFNILLPSNASKLRDESVWCGGSILATLPQMKDLWIKKKDYNEYGPGIVWRKAF
jgi:actin-related protein